jgi:hypothetical protein
MNNRNQLFLLALILYPLLNGCVPNATKYWHINAPGAVYFHSECYGSSGPRSIAYYPYHGIYLSLELPDTLALHIPPGSVVQLNATVIRVHGLSGDGPFDATLNMQAMSHGGFANSGPMKIYGSGDPHTSDPYTSHDNFGPLRGGRNDEGKSLWYRYEAKGPIPKGAISGTLELPSVTVDGQHYEPQVLTFTQKTFVGFMPINC